MLFIAEVSLTCAERSRIANTAFLRKLEPRGTAANVAIAMGTSETTVSNTKDKMEASLALLYQLGFKVVDDSRICVQRETYAAMVTLARRAMADEAMVKKLTWDEEE